MLPCGRAQSGPARGAVCRVAGRSTGVRELVRPGTTHGSRARIRNTGRHVAHAERRHARPGQLNKLVKGAAMVAPAVAVASAAVAAVHAHGPASVARSDAAKSGARPSAAPPTRSSSPSASSSPSILHCAGSSVMLPANYAAIVSFLTAHGYTKFAAAGIAGNMYQESMGNPESVGTGGGGLIGWTPLPAGFVTVNPVTDLRTQLAAVPTYNQQWSQYIPALNAATSATAAADIYMTYFERPGLPAAANREGAAAAVAGACGF